MMRSPEYSHAMSVLQWFLRSALPLLAISSAAAAQDWGDRAVGELVARAITIREAAETGQSSRRWTALARGTVLFLSQIGGDEAPPHLVKADELAVEVYWDAPGPGKQRIVAWRDRAWLPTDIRYHRDHLGIVTNDFGPLIRIGEGDEVRDVPHPLSTPGAPLYQFRLGGALTLRSGTGELTVRAVHVRPRDFGTPAVVGIMYLDVATAALVRFQFSFTPSAYLEAELEDITVMLESALHEGRSWLPWRQEIMIRRRAGVVDFPARGIIRGSWELGALELDATAPPWAVPGPAIGGLLAPGGSGEYWDMPLEARALGVLGEVPVADLDALRAEFRRVTGAGVTPPQPPIQPAIGRVSEIVRANRVEGVRVGAAVTTRPPLPGTPTIRTWVGYGFADRRLSGRIGLTVPLGARVELYAGAGREVEDVAGELPVSPVLNSVLAQEAGSDYGDWLEHRILEVRGTARPAGGVRVQARLAWEEWRTVSVTARPARGEYAPNPALGAGRYATARVEARRRVSSLPEGGLSWLVAAEMGTGASRYLRLDGRIDWVRPVGLGVLSLHTGGGWATREVPVSRTMAIGGWGTLPGEPYRAYGGRWTALGRLEYLLPLPIPELSLGGGMGTGRYWHVGPFVAAGAGGGATAIGPRPPWGTSDGIRPVVGIAWEGIWRLVRIELGIALRSGVVGGSADLAAHWRPIL